MRVRRESAVRASPSANFGGVRRKEKTFALIDSRVVRVPARELDVNYIELTDLGYCTDFPG